MALAFQIETFRPEVLAMAPKCRIHRCEMVEKGLGLFRCPDPTCDSAYDEPADAGTPPDGDGSPKQTLTPVGRNALVDRAAPYWLAHLGLQGPLPDIPQCNITDGKRCLMLGGVAHGGGNKSGRRRKKPPKGGKTFVNTPWGAEGGTNRK